MTEQAAPHHRRRRHVARSARIFSTGISATAILGITAAFGASERSHAAAADASPTDEPSVAQQAPSDTNAPSALAPLGTPAVPVADAVTQFPSTEGTVTLPAPTPTPAAQPAQVQSNAASIVPETAPTTLPVVTAAPVPVVTVAPVPVDTIAPIAPAEPPVQMTLPPAPSRGSSGGSH